MFIYFPNEINYGILKNGTKIILNKKKRELDYEKARAK